jgi:flagellar biosynthesis protein FlhF
MKIIRHTARDMRQALRAVREQLGEDAVILSSRRTGEGVEVTAAVDFDASTLEAGGFSNAPAATPLPSHALPPPIIDATAVAVVPAAKSARGSRSAAAALPPATRAPAAQSTRASRSAAVTATGEPATRSSATHGAAATRSASGATEPRSASKLSATAFALMTGRAPPMPAPSALPAPTDIDAETDVDDAGPAPSYDELAALEQPDDYDDGVTFTSHASQPSTQHASPRRARTAASSRGAAYHPVYEADLISEAAREAVVEHLASERAPVLTPAPAPAQVPAAEARASRATVSAQEATRAKDTTAPAASRANAQRTTAKQLPAPQLEVDEPAEAENAGSYEDRAARDPVDEIREATLTPLASNEIKATFAEFAANAAASASPAATEAMGNELKTLRRMLENQLAHLAWNDLTRRAPVHTEILRELTEIGITQDLAEHLVRQLPEDQDLTFARRFTIAGLSQYLKVTGDHWLDDGGRVAFVGATGVGKTTTLAKIAVRWVLRHGARDIALVAADPVRIGAQDQIRSLAQLLGVSVYTPESFEQLPTLLSRLSERLILIDTPGSSVRDSQLASRLAVLSNSASKLETALVLAASTQAGAIEEAVRRFAPANPSCCVLTKLDEAASLGGVLSALIRARLPVSYMSEGQRVPEDLRPARALELVSAAVRLAKARGAAADEDLLRRRFGKNAHGIS